MSEYRDLKGNTYLLSAVIEGNITETTWLLSKGSNINVYNNDRNTALHLAVINNDINMVQLLLNNGCIIFYENNNKETALKIAYQKQYTLIIAAIETAIISRETKKDYENQSIMFSSIIAYKELIECFEKKLKYEEDKTPTQKITEYMTSYILT